MFPDITRDDVFRLETRRLWLAWPCANDANGIARIASRWDVAEMTSRIPHPYPAGAAGEWIMAGRQANRAGEALTLVMRQKAGARDVTGFITLFERDGALEIGYAIDPPSWGKGYATEAAQMVIAIAFAITDEAAIAAAARTGNCASQRVLRKLGFAFCGTALADMPARGGHYPVDRFVLTRSQWRRQESAVAASLPPGASIDASRWSDAVLIT